MQVIEPVFRKLADGTVCDGCVRIQQFLSKACLREEVVKTVDTMRALQTVEEVQFHAELSIPVLGQGVAARSFGTGHVQLG